MNDNEFQSQAREGNQPLEMKQEINLTPESDEHLRYLWGKIKLLFFQVANVKYKLGLAGVPTSHLR
jgi:hypothetical protein